MDRHKKYWMDKKTLLYHIENLIKYDVGEKVFTFGMFSSGSNIPRINTISGIHVSYSYGDDSPSPYKIEYQMKGDEHGISQDSCRKYDEKVAKIIEEYHSFFDALKADEGT